MSVQHKSEFCSYIFMCPNALKVELFLLRTILTSKHENWTCIAYLPNEKKLNKPRISASCDIIMRNMREINAWELANI